MCALPPEDWVAKCTEVMHAGFVGDLGAFGAIMQTVGPENWAAQALAADLMPDVQEPANIQRLRDPGWPCFSPNEYRSNLYSR